MRSVRPILTLAASIIFFTAQPAAADDGRRHVMTPTQKIDMVRDLPDIPAFEKDGMHYDLGYIYPIRTVNGASVATTGRASETGFVLYHDDRYVMADSSIMADLEFVLGEDPTQGYNPPTASSSARATGSGADPWGSNGARDSAEGQPITSPPPVRRRSWGQGWIAVFVAFMLFSFIRWGRNMLFRGVFNMVSGGSGRTSSPYADYPDDRTPSEPFDSRVSARLSQLQGGGAPVPQAYEPAAPVAPAVRGFGRKGA